MIDIKKGYIVYNKLHNSYMINGVGSFTSYSKSAQIFTSKDEAIKLADKLNRKDYDPYLYNNLEVRPICISTRIGCAIN